MKTAILGGSFNPVHVGHLFLADSALAGLGYDRIILIPAFQSPFKLGAEGAPPEDRLKMLAASIAGDPRLTIDDCEIRREGVSFTIDTIKDVIARYSPEGKPGLILGDDLASTFHKWRQHEEIARLADIVIARRLTAPELPAGESARDTGAGGRGFSPADTFPYPYRALDNEIIDVSSQMVREKIRRNENWRYMVPSGARYIIEDRGLYGFSAFRGGDDVLTEKDTRGAPLNLTETIARVENDVRAALDLRRFIHSRNTALLVWDLCRRFGFDPRKGYLAGIAHDLCKTLAEEELIRLARADSGTLAKLEHKKPGLLHARAAAVLLRKKYGIADRDILDAIKYHTTGTRDMGSLAKLVYIADKIEISRTGVDPALREMARSADLAPLFSAVLNNTVAYLKSRKVDISYGTKRLLAAMRERSPL